MNSSRTFIAFTETGPSSNIASVVRNRTGIYKGPIVATTKRGTSAIAIAVAGTIGFAVKIVLEAVPSADCLWQVKGAEGTGIRLWAYSDSPKLGEAYSRAGFRR